MSYHLSALAAAARIGSGLLSSRELVTACLGRIEASDANIGAWAHLDPENALAQADALDRIRQKGLPMGPLHGVPVGIKDIFDTAGMPTEFGSKIHRGRQPDRDCAAVARLRDAGAVIMGKTVTTEFAFLNPADTRNPHDASRTPGGSSSGSAAAVAAGHVPLALGSQTNGSTVRPASFCGIYGFKPSYGVISRSGVLETSVTLDQVGLFARTLEDVAALCDVVAGYDPRDKASYPYPRPQCLHGARAQVPAKPDLAYFDLPYRDLMSSDATNGLDEVLERLGDRVKKYPAPDMFSRAIDCHRIIHEYEIARNLEREIAEHWDDISDTLKPVLERGRALSSKEYTEAVQLVATARAEFADMFNDIDAVITVGAAGEAPLRTSGTGDPVFCTIWTFCGLPSVSLPLLAGSQGLPIGLQLIGSYQGDDRLMRTAHWVEQQLTAGEREAESSRTQEHAT